MGRSPTMIWSQGFEINLRKMWDAFKIKYINFAEIDCILLDTPDTSNTPDTPTPSFQQEFLQF